MRKIVLSLFCIILLFTTVLPGFSVLAEEECKVTVATVKGNTGDTVYVPISIDNNPGISAITATFTYNSKALIYSGYTKGPAFTDNFMLKEHPDKNQIKIALVEYSKDSTNNDDILTLKFKISDSATAELHKIDVQYGKGDFANRKLESVMPKIISGGVEVAYNPDAKNCTHKNYSDWKIAVKPTCNGKGVEQRICALCGHNDTRNVDPTGHVYEDKWTIDVPATKAQDGVMTRHCKHCTASVDRITFSYSDPETEDFENSVGTEVPKDDYTEDLFKEQHPGEELTGTKPDEKDNASSKSASSTASKNNSQTSKTADSKDESTLSQNTESETQKEETVTSQTQSDSGNKTFENNKPVLIIFGVIILVILFATIAIVACIKPKR